MRNPNRRLTREILNQNAYDVVATGVLPIPINEFNYGTADLAPMTKCGVQRLSDQELLALREILRKPSPTPNQVAWQRPRYDQPTARKQQWVAKVVTVLEAEHRGVLAQLAAALRAKAGSLQAEDKARDATD